MKTCFHMQSSSTINSALRTHSSVKLIAPSMHNFFCISARIKNKILMLFMSVLTAWGKLAFPPQQFFHSLALTFAKKTFVDGDFWSKEKHSKCFCCCWRFSFSNIFKNTQNARTNNKIVLKKTENDFSVEIGKQNERNKIKAKKCLQQKAKQKSMSLKCI